MLMAADSERDVWKNVTEMLGDTQKKLGRHWSYNLYNDPKRIAFVLSRYKFAAKMACKNKHILELGCSEGIGAPILAEFADSYTGVDLDGPAIQSAKGNLSGNKFHFIHDDFLGKHFGTFDCVISLDVIEHIHRKYETLFLDTIKSNLGENGICIVGTPNVTSEQYASEMSRAGHVNLYDAQKLVDAMGTLFHNVFLFGMNDEVVHTGFSPMAHYLLAVGCYKK
jgi:2-polyprenyl-3-methyl-5-hydroxy-6-metoxy-1,4-benzoquinol methylase